MLQVIHSFIAKSIFAYSLLFNTKNVLFELERCLKIVCSALAE